MKVTGIIAEYNPFHNGHQFHIEETRRNTHADYCVALMSGDFVQRGAPALLSKYERTKMALENGADLVIELPLCAALSSAEGFASGAVSLCKGLGIIDTISCGCETAQANPSLFFDVVSLLADEPDDYRALLSKNLSSGMSFPRARQAAVFTYFDNKAEKEATPSAALEEQHAFLTSLLTSPNNILALEYAKAIRRTKANLSLSFVKRCGSDYHEQSLSGTYVSATAIRKQLASPSSQDVAFDALQQGVPASVYEQLRSSYDANQLLTEADFSDCLYYALLTQKDCLKSMGPTESDLASRCANLLEQYENWSQFASLLKTKNQTHTAVSRFLTHALLQLSREDFLCSASFDHAPFARVLGFRKDASALLCALQAHATLPVIVSIAKDTQALNDDQRRLFALQIRAGELYRHVRAAKSGMPVKPELRQSIIVI